MNYKFNSTMNDFKFYNQFQCYSLDDFNYQYSSRNSTLRNVFDAKNLFNIPSAISTSKQSSLFTNSTQIFTNWETQPSNYDDYFCSEKVSKINSKYSQTFLVNLSLNSSFFSIFFQNSFLFPTFQENVQFELSDYVLQSRLKKVQKFSLFKNYMFYFTPVIIFGAILVFLLFRKVISEMAKYKDKFD
jgi:hypothetical protein